MSYYTVTMAAEIPFEKFRILDDGMSVAEVVLLAGEPDRETHVQSHRWVSRKIWYYIPKDRSGWLTTITFDNNGRVFSIERVKP
ncbi:hypothetical protein EDC63_13017 [Sulfurirhabdus autotrophica]|uniref:SmpA/OmlA family protein n=2 Tax=Sulfurirhabdus autotrophica TaxID=1706046 RepID=A0A4R3XVA8_9PROT|nr:hypothetical protein EDC63_13017 [Sulfurirhabdus autotrophica]